LGISIKAKDAQSAVQTYRGQSSGLESGNQRPSFSNERFVDAIVEFIVGDDQVSIMPYIIINLIFCDSQSMLLNRQDYVLYFCCFAVS